MRWLALLVLVLFGQVPPPPQAPAPIPDDFALRYEFGCPSRDTIDTFTGTYSRSYRSQRTRLDVSPVVKRELYSAVQEARFFGLPSRVSGLLCEPMILSTLEVRANGTTQITTWDSCSWGADSNPGNPFFKLDPEKADVHRRLYRLESLIVGAFRNQQGIRRLRGESAICL